MYNTSACAPCPVHTTCLQATQTDCKKAEIKIYLATYTMFGQQLMRVMARSMEGSALTSASRHVPC
jgi:hypothetical protein